MSVIFSCISNRLCTSSSLSSCGLFATMSILSLLIYPCHLEKEEFRGFKVSCTFFPVFPGYCFLWLIPAAADLQLDYSLTDDFCRNHFLVGLLLREVGGALQECREIRQIAVQVLKGLMIKHTFDDRYVAKVSVMAAFILSIKLSN